MNIIHLNEDFATVTEGAFASFVYLMVLRTSGMVGVIGIGSLEGN